MTLPLRWYDKKGLLKPARTTAAGYRLYGEREVDRRFTACYDEEVAGCAAFLRDAIRAYTG